MAKKVIDIELRPSGSGVKSLNDSLKDLKKNVQEATDPAKAEKLNKALKQTEKEVEGINNAISGFDLDKKFDDIYEGSAPLSSRLGELEDRMYELAFAGKANTEEFKALQGEAIKMRKTIIQVDKQVDILADNQGLAAFGSGLGAVGDSLFRLDFETASKQAATLADNAGKISFKEATTSLKNMGKTFASLGKALLTNPIFIIATVVGTIIIGIIALLDELGILKVIFEAVGDAIGWVVQQLKDFLDWLGITNYAAEDAAEKAAENAKKRADAQEFSTNKVVAALDFEMAKMNAQGDLNDEQFEKMLALEKQKRIELSKTAKARLDEAVAAVRAAIIKGDASEEELIELRDTMREQVAAYKKATRDIEVNDIAADKARKDRLNKATQEEKAELKERQDAWNQYQQNRLNAERQVEDLRISLIENSSEREIEQNRVKYERLIQDTKANTELIESEKLELIRLYEQKALELSKKNIKEREAEEAASIKRIAKLRDQANKDWKDKEEDLVEEIRQLGLTEEEKEIEKVEEEFFQKIEIARQHGLNTEALEEEQQSRVDEIKQRYADKEQQRIKDERDAKIKSFQSQLQEGAQFFNALSGLSSAVAEAQIANAEGNESKQEQIRKKAFERNKKLQIAMATISGIQGVINALTAQTMIPDPFGTILKAVNAAIVGATTIAQIAKIKSTSYKGGGGGSVGAASGGGGGASAASAMPNISMFGQSNDLNSLSDAKSVEKETPTVKAVVVESDITDTQAKVKKINESAEL